jgi:hypothetical protein
VAEERGRCILQPAVGVKIKCPVQLQLLLLTSLHYYSL